MTIREDDSMQRSASARKPAASSHATMLVMAIVAAVVTFALGGFMATNASAEPNDSLASSQTVFYDVSKAGLHTNYRITESGNYYLSGRSNSVSICVEPREGAIINIYLEGNLRIDPTWSGRRGILTATPAISVGEAKDATVNIIAMEETNAYLGGYYGAAAVRKNGTATRLVFSTLAPDGSGKITAVGSSHGSCPGIGVDAGKGTVGGNIVFESGTIEARGHDAPGIGCKDGSVTISDVTFSGATVTATGGGGNSAGIGSGKDGTVKNIMISGGTVTATGSGAGAGIGSGGNGTAQDIYVAGGTVVATGSGAGAGIGSGRNGTAKSIVVSGGVVTATGGTGSYGGAGIGSGANVDSERNGSTQNIVVSGGTVTATGGPLASGIGGAFESPVYNIIFGVVGQPTPNLSVSAQGGSQGAGIGAGTGEMRTTAEKIVVYGGTINATGSSEGGAGIGSGYQSGRCSDIRIVGGKVTATGGRWSSGIGSAMMSGTFSGITIEGGIITAKRGADSYDLCDIGSPSTMDILIAGGTVDAAVASDGLSPIVITGGTVREISAEYDTPPLVDDKGQPVYRTVATVEGLTESTHIEDLNIGIGQGSATQRLDYGQTDLYTLDEDGAQKLFLYLPASTYTRTADDANGLHYRGNIYPGDAGTLRLCANVRLDSGQGASYDGSALALYGASQLDIEEDPYDELDREVDHYADSVGRPVADADGNLYNGTTNFTANGTWTSRNPDATLRTVWKAKTYTIAYKTNKPDGASTKMHGEDGHAFVDPAQTDAHINTNSYVLPGYRFVEWNTEPDGSGLSREDGTLIDNELFLEADDSNVVTLYAQWEPLTYTVTFMAGDGTGTMEPQTLVFDQEAALARNAYECASTSGARSFLYWSDEDEAHYADGATVKNLCTISDEPVPRLIGHTLTAQWSVDNSVVIAIASNGEPVVLSNPSSDIRLVSTDDPTRIVTGFEATDAAGVYQRSNVDTGTYTVDVDASQATGFPTDTDRLLEVESTGSNSFSLSYCTITVDAADEYVNVWIGNSPLPTEDEERTWTVFQGEEVTIQAVVNPDATPYPRAFAGYTVDGIVSADFDLSDPGTQTITVTGGVTITAHSRPISYDLAFESNYPTNASTHDEATGSMDTITGISASDQVSLPFCAFSLPGYAFSSWNTRADGSGETYAGGDIVENLAAADGEKVTLYAQWKPISYTVDFDANGGNGEMNAQVLAFDVPQNLAKSLFTRPNYMFAGWATEPVPAAGAAYADEALVSSLTRVDGGTVTLYAQWERDSYTVTFEKNADDAVGTMGDEVAPTLEDWMVPGCGFTRTGYRFAGWNTQADGNGDAYTAGDIVAALADAGETVMLYAQWEPISYTVAFDANAPERASTADAMTGEMDSCASTYGAPSALPSNKFVLPGYEFAGWNTQPDGGGASYADGEEVVDLTTEDGATVTLFAQWEPLAYEVAFEGTSQTTGTMAPQTLRFDEPAALSKNAFSIADGGMFVGWSIRGETGAGARLLADEQTVVNLCTIEDDGSLAGFTLVPITTWENGAFVTVTKDAEPLSGATVTLIGPDGSLAATMTEMADEVRGTYHVGDLAPGAYRIEVEGLPATGVSLTVESGEVAHAFISFFTVAVECDSELATVELNGSSAEASAVVATGGTATIRTVVREGGVFEGYTVDGIAPEAFDASNPDEQTIAVAGTATITANVRPIEYLVSFDSNGGTGSMEPQLLSYNEEQKLTACAFTRDGSVFAGWNTQPDGSGTPYEDGATVSNLASTDGETVVLYAQWEPEKPPTHEVAVAVHAHGAASVDAPDAPQGSTVTLTVEPDEGFEVRSITAVDAQGGTVALEEQGNGAYTFTMPDADVSITVLLGCDGGESCPSRRFPDADASQWYHDALDWAIVHSVLNGCIGSGLMEPDSPITRAQMAQVLWNTEGRPQTESESSFDDVAETDWFAEPVAWATGEGLFEGYVGTESFGPDDPITREQAAAVMMRWSERRGSDVSMRADLSSFPDAGDVSDWATEYLSWAVAADIIKGAEPTADTLLLDPQGSCSRAQVAMLMMRLLATDPLDPFA